MSSSLEEEETRSPLLVSDPTSTTGAQEANQGEEPIKVYSDSHEHYRSIQMSNIQMVHQRQGKPAQRVLLLCHFGFKFLALLIYLFSGFIGLGYITTFVFVIMILSIDFWVVKNLSGRLLAGLRWWSVTDESTGQMVWRFEAWTPEEAQLAYKSQAKILTFLAINLFWTGLFAQQIIWSTLLFACIFRFNFSWIIITVIACCLNGSNLYGYIRCRWQAKTSQNQGFFARLRETASGLFKTAGYMRGTTTPMMDGF